MDDEKENQTLVNCVDCRGSGEWSLGDHSCWCETCKGEGVITESKRHQWRVRNNRLNSITSLPYNQEERYKKRHPMFN
jgi:DnaJ-class molecular chaperone